MGVQGGQTQGKSWGLPEKEKKSPELKELFFFGGGRNLLTLFGGGSAVASKRYR